MPEEEPIFPSVAEADADGLVAIGGRLDPDWVVRAYEQGIFPWPIEYGGAHILAWFAPHPRAIIELNRLVVSRRLARRIRSGVYRVTCDRQFTEVMRGCAGPRAGQDGTWITPGMIDSYGLLHRRGVAHSIEVWEEADLVGGLYGVSLGGFFAGESMFHRRTDASKVALVYLVAHLTARKFELFDIQQLTPHTVRLGATAIPRTEFQTRLAAALRCGADFGSSLDQSMLAQVLTDGRQRPHR